MDFYLCLLGLIIGFSIAAPVGPIGVLCIRRTLHQGRSAGLLSGLGAATADALYGCVAGFGLTLISNLLIRQQVWFGLIGGAFLCYLGVRTLLTGPSAVQSAPPSPSSSRYDLMRAYASTFFLTLTNPATILSFAAVFAGLGLGRAGEGYVSAILLVLGVFTGSALWWLILSGGVSLLRGRLDANRLTWVNRLSGLIITGFGLSALLKLAS